MVVMSSGCIQTTHRSYRSRKLELVMDVCDLKLELLIGESATSVWNITTTKKLLQIKNNILLFLSDIIA